MKIAIIGGGSSGLVTGYFLDKKGHQVTLFEKQPILGGHIRTLNKNIQPNQSPCQEILECGVLEFPTNFYNFINLMQELEVELEPVYIGSGLFLQDGRHFLSGEMIKKNFAGFDRFLEYLRLDTVYARSAGLWIKLRFSKMQDFYDQSVSQYLKRQCIRNTWLKLLMMYSYSINFDLIDNFPAELAIPMLQKYVFIDWVRVKGGVYSYIDKILARFKGQIWTNTAIKSISRSLDGVNITLPDGVTLQFDKVVFATPPDQVMQILVDPSEQEIKRFSSWSANNAKTVLHSDMSLYSRYGIKQFSEFDFFQTDHSWGYNAYLNQLCGIVGDRQYSLAFQVEELIAKDKIIHIQQHHTPLYTVEAFRYRDEVVMTNGENNTYHAGAYLGDGLHEGAITAAVRVSELIG
jgi:uncharacterized protein